MRPTAGSPPRFPPARFGRACRRRRGGNGGVPDDATAGTTGTLPRPRPISRRDADAHRRRPDVYGQQYRADPANVEVAMRYAQALRANRAARPGCRRPREGLDREPAQQGRARRLRPGAGRRRQLRSGFASTRPRPYAGPARLAHPLGARRGARPDGPPRRSAALLSDRAEDGAGRAFGVVKSWSLLRAVEESARSRKRRCAARRRSLRSIRGCGRTLRLWSACKAASPRPKTSRAPTCRRTKPPPMSPICGRCWRTAKTCAIPTPRRSRRRRRRADRRHFEPAPTLAPRAIGSPSP